MSILGAGNGMNEAELVAVFDVGGSAVKAGVVDSTSGEFAFYTDELQIGSSTAEKFVGELPAAVNNLISDANCGGVAAVGISVAGMCRDGRLIEAPNLRWYDYPLVEAAENALGNAGLKMPVSMQNDADCFTLGECLYGVARGKESVLGITMGTGIGGGFVKDGGIFRGGMGYSIEPGHVKVNYDLDTLPCSCGARYCLEAGAGARGIVHLYRVYEGDAPDDISVEDIFARAEAGDEIAVKTFRRVGSRMGIGLAGLCNLLNPEAVVIGGGVSKARKFIEPSLMATLESETLVSIRGNAVLLWSELLSKANLLGAASAAAAYI